MNLRQLFTNQPWWGKFIGAFFGYLVAGPLGAFFGVLLGNVFDKGLMLHLQHQGIHDHLKHHATQTKQMFLHSTFTMMGYLAKADGRVSEQEIAMANQIMRELKLSAAQQQKARYFFNLGKQQDFNPNQELMKLLTTLQFNQPLLKLFVDIQFQAAQIDGLSAAKINALNNMLGALGFAPLQHQDQFTQQDTSDFQQRASGYQQKSRANSNYTDHTLRSTPLLDAAYALLQITPTSSQQEVKKAYQRLMSRNHPDKLIAKKAPAAQIKLANEKTQNIRKAYELICSSKGW